MSGLLIEEKQVVVPGEELAKGMDYLPGFGTYRDNDAIRACRHGLLSVEGRALKIIPLSGRYIPKKYDVVIAKIVDVLMSGWILETNSAYRAMINVKDATSSFIERGADLSQIFGIGDYVVGKIVNVTSQKLVDISTKAPGMKKLVGGRIIHVNPYKVPRIIGKQGSMVSMIKRATGCKITVGQNGVIWLSGEPEKEVTAYQAIRMIEDQAHISGLTDVIKTYLEKICGKGCADLIEEGQDSSNESEFDNENEGYHRNKYDNQQNNNR